MNKRINPTLSEGIDGDVFERVLADVRGHIWEHRKFAKLAQAANLSLSTVSKLAYGGTVSPHIRTVIRIMDALGKSDPVLEAFRSEHPVSVASAQSWKKRQVKRKPKKQPAKKMHPRHGSKSSIRASVRRAQETSLH